MHILICFLLLCYLHGTGFLEHALLHLVLVKLEALHPISILNPDAQVHAHLTRGATGCSGVPASLLTSASAESQPSLTTGFPFIIIWQLLYWPGGLPPPTFLP